MNAWYREALQERIAGRMDDTALDAYLQQVRRQERMLSDEGVVLLKFWIHLSRDAQKKRIAALEADPRTRWRITAADKRALKLYSKSHAVWEHVLRETSTGMAPWYVVEGCGRALPQPDRRQDPARHAAPDDRRAGEAARHRSRRGADHLGRRQRQADPRARPDEADDREGLRNRDREVPAPARAPLAGASGFAERSLIVVFEGADAAGKGGAIRRVAGALDARFYAIVPIAAPTDEERAHPYLWRFWRHVPARGGVAIFDRSWYGRVLVERVEGFCTGRRLAARLRRDQRVRGAARPARRRSSSSSGCRSARTSSWRASRRARRRRYKQLQDHRRGLAQPREVGRLRAGGRRHGRPHQHRATRRGRWSRRTTSATRGSRC